jgi:hypothetical protein
MMEAVRTSETSVDNHFTRQYNPEDSSEHHVLLVVQSIIIPKYVCQKDVRTRGAVLCVCLYVR